MPFLVVVTSHAGSAPLTIRAPSSSRSFRKQRIYSPYRAWEPVDKRVDYHSLRRASFPQLQFPAVDALQNVQVLERSWLATVSRETSTMPRSGSFSDANKPFCAINRSKGCNLTPECPRFDIQVWDHRTPEPRCRKCELRRSIRFVPVLMPFYPQWIIRLWVEPVENIVDISTLVHKGKAEATKGYSSPPAAVLKFRGPLVALSHQSLCFLAFRIRARCAEAPWLRAHMTDCGRLQRR